MRGRGLFGVVGAVDAAAAMVATDAIDLDQYALEVFVDVDADPVTAPSACTGGGTVAAGTNPAAGLALTNVDVPVAWMEIEAPSGTKRYAKVPINLDNTPKIAKVYTFGKVKRRISNNLGDLRSADIKSTLIDEDRVLRGLEDSDNLVNSLVSYFVSTEAAIRAGSAPRRMFTGPIVDSDPMPGLEFDVTVKDWLTAILDELAKKTYPTRTFGAADFPNLLTAADDASSPGNPMMNGKAVPIIYGSHRQVQPIYVGKRVVNAFNWDESIVCGHAIKAINQWSAVDSANGDRAAMPLTTEGVDFLIPGYAGYTLHTGSANPYVDINSNRYTRILTRGPRSDAHRLGTVPIILDVCGIESVGDGSGTMIDSLLRQILHLLINWILAPTTYTSGAWLASPSFTVGGSTWSKIDTATFETAKTTSEARIAGGYKGAFILGWDGRTHQLEEIFRSAARSADIDFFINRHGQLAVSMFDSTIASTRTVVDLPDILKASFSAKRERTKIINKVTYRYGRKYVDPVTQKTPAEDDFLPAGLREPDTEWTTVGTPVTDGASITKYGERKADLDLDFVTEQATADDVALKLKNRDKNGPMRGTFSEILQGADCDISQKVTTTHLEGPTATGWTARPLRVEGQETDLDKLTVTHEARDLTGL
jgi:hypothetical protein